MSETQVDHSTNGEGQWLCFIHFQADAPDWFRITGELSRLRWLADIVRALRAGAEITVDMHKNFVLAQRSDLKQSDREDRTGWMIRLEGVLSQSCKDSMVHP